MDSQPFRLAVAGIAHGHVKIIHRSPYLPSLAIVGVFERDASLREAYRDRHGLDPGIMHDDLGRMLDEAKPEAVCAFGSIHDHRAVVEAAAPRGIHVMVEKPLAVSVEHARAMLDLAGRHGIHLLTNYETTWYASTHHAIGAADRGELGALRKIAVHDGHAGPVEIGCDPHFVAWLTDPKQSGGGALPDFGCYGANLAMRLMRGRRPLSVQAVTHRFKPQLYPAVEDDATILLSYGDAEAVVQGSWNWPVARKDMELYGSDGQLTAVDGRTVRSRMREHPSAETTEVLPPLPSPLDDPFAHLAAVVRGTLKLEDDDLAGPANNLAVVEILEAAQRSARSGRAEPLGGTAP